MIALSPGDGAYSCEEPLAVLVDLCLGRPTDNGAPGLRKDYGPNYYAAFVIDPDGYRIEAYCGAEA